VEPCSGRAGNGLDGPAVLGRMHDLGALRRLATQGAAQLADDPLLADGDVDVDPFPDERVAVAVMAARPAGAECTDAAPEQGDLGWRAAELGVSEHGLRTHSPELGSSLPLVNPYHLPPGGWVAQAGDRRKPLAKGEL
jgi:hypothetical protein